MEPLAILGWMVIGLTFLTAGAFALWEALK